MSELDRLELDSLYDIFKVQGNVDVENVNDDEF